MATLLAFFTLSPASVVLLGFLLLIPLLGVGLRGRGVSVAGPALVLKRFDVDPSNPHALLNLVGRPQGIIGWFLSAIGIDTTTTLCVAQDYVHLNQSSLSGQFRQTAPVHTIASTHCGYSMNLGLIILAVLVGFGGLIGAAALDSFVPFLFGVVFAGLLVLGFFLSKSLVIAFETYGGLVLGVRFKQGIIDNVPLGLEHLGQVIALFNQQIGKTPPTLSPTANSASVDRWYYARAGKRFGPVSAAELKQMAMSGQLSPNDMVLKEGTANWVPLHQLKGLTHS